MLPSKLSAPLRALLLPRRLGPAIALLLPLGLALPVSAEWVAYSAADRSVRQEAALPACRAALDLAEPFGPDDTNEFTTNSQAEFLNCELEAWRRDPGLVALPDVAQREAEVNAHLRRLLERVALGIAAPKCTGKNPQVPSGCFTNIVIARMAGHLTAYILNRYTERTWEPATLETARALYRDPNWWQGLGSGGNSFTPLIGMRLLGGEALDDPVLASRGTAELHYIHGRDLRQGIPEPMSRHYAGSTMGQLELLRETNDLTLRAMVEDMLALRLLVNAHNYLPGGQAGAPLDRKHGPLGFLDARGNGDSLLHHLNMTVNDPDMSPDVGHARHTLASDYVAPEAIRSIFLDKGEGYSFWYRALAPDSTSNGAGYEGERHYPSYGWQGFDGLIPTAYESSPWQTVTLAEGAAQLGIMYAAGGDTGFSNGVFARDDSDLFSVYYHHQPRPDSASRSAWDPLTDDPSWRHEAHTPYRRLLHGRTAITLFDPHDEHDFLMYTIAHLPGAVGSEIMECPGDALPGGSSWLVGEHAGAWAAYLPLGAHTRETKDAGLWTFLRFASDAISGNITELAEKSAYADAAAYCADLAGRNVSFDEVAAIAQLEATPAEGGRVALRLDYYADARSIDSGSGFAVQADDGFVDRGVMHVAPVAEAGWLDWTGPFQLEVNRAPYPVVDLDFGDPSLPSPPQTLTVQNEVAVNTAPIQLLWDHGVDDGGIVEYKIWRDGVEIASVFANDPDDPFSADAGRQARFADPREPISAGAATAVQYRIESVDGDGNHSPVKSMIREITVQPLPPTAPVLTSAVGGVKQVTLDWTPASDNWGISHYEVFRDGVPMTSLDATTSTYVDASARRNRSYEYVVRAYDLAGLSADSAALIGTPCKARRRSSSCRSE
jgi:hypothetical protein